MGEQGKLVDFIPFFRGRYFYVPEFLRPRVSRRDGKPRPTTAFSMLHN
jgi:hypothetical protein